MQYLGNTLKIYSLFIWNSNLIKCSVFYLTTLFRHFFQDKKEEGRDDWQYRQRSWKVRLHGTSLVVQWLGLHASTAWGTVSVLSGVTKISHAAQNIWGRKVGLLTQEGLWWNFRGKKVKAGRELVKLLAVCVVNTDWFWVELCPTHHPSPANICLSPKPQSLWMWLYLEIWLLQM